MSIDYPPAILEMCGISQLQLEERIHLLETHFGTPFMESLLHRYGGFSVSLVNQICEKSILADELSTVTGFKVIGKKITDLSNHRASLSEPHGEWFQLTHSRLPIKIT
jgi:hypothetical protein